MIRGECSEDANIIFGVGFDQNLEDEMRITIIATGFTKKAEAAAEAAEVKTEEAPKEEAKAAPAPKAEPKASGTELDLDDWLGGMFGNK